MKQTSLIIALAATVVLTACGGGQKPSKRDNVWGENVDTSVVAKNQVKGEKVLVPFKRINNDLLEVQVSLNGVPFNMWWDTGASVTCISLLELQKLAKEGKISMDDYQGPAFSKIADGSTTRADALLYGINLARKELSHPALFLFAFMLPLVSSCFILAKAILLTREIFWAALFFFFWLSSLNETSNCQCRLFSIPQCFLATLSMVSASIGNEVI